MNPDQVPPAAPAPVTAPVSTPPVAAAPAAAPRRSRATTVAAIVAVLLLALAGAGYAWAYRGAETVLPAAFAKLTDPGTVRSDAHLDFDIVAEGDEYNFSVDVSSAGDQTDPEHPKALVNVGAEFDGMKGTGELRFVDDTLYLKASQIPGISLADDPAAEALVGQWFFISLADLEAATGQSVAEAAEAGEEARAKLHESVDRLFDSEAVTFGAPKIRSVDGDYVREYPVSFNADAFADFTIDEVNRFATTTELKEELGQFEPVIRAVAPGFSLEGATVQVSLLSGELRGIQGALSFDASKVDQRALAEASGGEFLPEDQIEGRFRVAFDIAYHGYGEPVTVEVPAGATSILGSFGDVGGSPYYGDETPADAEFAPE